MAEQHTHKENEDKTKEKKQKKLEEEEDSPKIEKEKNLKGEAGTKKQIKKEKKEEAVAYGTNVHASKKQCMYICDFIKRKSIDRAIIELSEVISKKRAIPFRGEIPHRKEKGIMSGRYPVKASGFFISLLKGLKGNVIVNGLDLDKTRISLASASWASRPQRRGGMRFKRSYVVLKAREFPMEEKNK